MYCEVYLLDAPYHLDRSFDYSCTEAVSAGNFVRVPFGRGDRLRTGIVTKIKENLTSENEEQINIKPVQSVIMDRFSLSCEMLGLCLFMKNYTLCTLGEAVKAVLPPGAFSKMPNIKYGKTCTLIKTKDEVEKILELTGRQGIRSEGQREILKFLLNTTTADTEILRQIKGVTTANINALVDKGIVKCEVFEQIRNPYSDYEKVRDTSEIVLSSAQNIAYGKIEELYRSDSAKCALLYGVTGSGKTKVIMKAIDRTIADKKTVIMLVPEISLTPQTVSIFCKRYGSRVAVIHSGLSQGERLDAYRRISRGDVDLVIGTRSAIFAPISNLGMIVIDEEHEHTYKSESDPKYHARDVASYRCGVHNALLLLASATPSLESFYKASIGSYTLVPLRERYGGVHLPQAIVVDMREELRLGNKTAISKRLLESLENVKARDEQAIIFLNRRGYSTQISCKECGEVMTCPHCSVSLTYHADKDGGKLVCHMCGYRVRMPKTCGNCGSDQLSFLGFGTQKLEGEFNKYLPDMRVMRMDADTTNGKMAYDRMLEDFRSSRADILLGTQMVAKGHDFPKVTLVGVALADTSLYVSDFRAAERTFSLLTQVIGRAGRAKDGGIAVIQTYSPNNETIRLACKQDYDSFYEGEIAIRKELSYPPFCDIVQLTLTSEDEKELFKECEELSKSILKKLEGEMGKMPFVVYGPFEANVYKVNEKYRMRMVIKCKLNSKSRKMFSQILCEFALKRKVVLAIDLNPLTV